MDSLGDELDFEDSLLRAVALPAPLHHNPEIGAGLGGQDGRRFKILERLGGGAMGCVYLAWDEQLHRKVALKFLLPRRTDEEMTALLRQEARVIAQLDHENIVRLFDVSDWQPGPGLPRFPFLVMESLEGESLDSLMRHEKLELPRVLRILAEVAAGLAHAHAQHVVHRDLKPSNIFITQEGRVKLLDFGLAYLLSSEPHFSSRRSLAMAGTPAYMAPEQWRGEWQDGRTDLWAAGVVLYELLTGTLPFPEGSPAQFRTWVTSPEPMPSVRERRPELPWEVAMLVDTALAKDPSQRFQTAQELYQEVRELEEHLGFRPSDSSSPRIQRRQVTLLACSLTGLDHMSTDPPDAEDLGELEIAFHRACAAAIQQAGGHLALSMGNEVLACFGHPQVHEEDAERAVRTGLYLSRHIPEEIQTRVTQFLSHPLAVKVGIHTDTVILEAGPVGTQGQVLTFRGEAPQRVRWLAKQAAPGTILLSGATWELVRGAFETQMLGPRDFQWLSGTTHLDVHQVLAERTAVSRFDRKRLASGLTPLVGRERELEALLAHWQQAQGGQGGAVLLYGEAGIGKSRLIREVGQRVAAEGGLWLQFQCWSQSGSSALRPVIELLRHSLREVAPEQRRGVLEERLAALGLSLEAIQLLVSLLMLEPPVPQVLRLSPERRKEATLEALVSLLLLGAMRQPILAVVEDLHWADPSTLELLGRVLRQLKGAPVLLVLSARPEFIPPWGTDSGFRSLTLERLSMEEISVLVRRVAWRRELPEDVVAQMAARTDGIPLFAEEMARLILGRGTARGAWSVPHAIPFTLQELLFARLDRLPSRLKSLAQLASVIGRSFHQKLLVQLTRRSEIALRRDLEGLLAAELLQPQEGSAEPGYQFRHALQQEAAYLSLPRSARRAHHRSIASVLVERFPMVVDEQPEVLAHHYTEAGDVETAIHYWVRAGELASKRLANEEAIRHLTLALQLLRSLPESPERPGQELKLLLTLGVPLVQVQGYGSPEVMRIHGRAHELLLSGDESLEMLELPYWSLYAYHFSRSNYSLAREVAEFMVGVGQRQHDPELLAQAYRMLSLISIIWGRLHEAQDHARHAELCSDFDLERHRAVAARQWINPRVAALSYGYVYQTMLNHSEEAYRYGLETMDLALRIGHPHTTAFALIQLAIGCHFREDAQGVLRWTGEAGRLADENRFRMWRAWASMFRSWGLAAVGRPQEGLRLSEEASEYLRTSGILAYQFNYNLGIRADILLRLGRPREALETLDVALRCLDKVGERFYEPELHRLRGESLRSLGREEAARESFSQALRTARAQGSIAFELKAGEALGLRPPLSPSASTWVSG
ncbi:protein kinase domain-containing protein [Archangium violaceum]|uniref:protein kinase domain-containing protein n=1 Tax=Archangium violaceum TaxID=83451 RepID=UPI001EF61A23|nr:protein kinase [Archangium violaceum]